MGPRSISNTIARGPRCSVMADTTAFLPTSTASFAILPRVLGLPHLLDLRFEISNLSLQFPDVSLPILLSAEDLPLECANDIRLAVITARLARYDGHRPRDFPAHIAGRGEIWA